MDESSYRSCELCPRACRVDRTSGQTGACGQTSHLRVARAALHMWEEPPISGESGSGAIFFSGCTLGCIFCQNHDISSGGFGQDITESRLAKIMLELADAGALNINLVTPMHFAPHVRQAVTDARAHGLRLPIVCNTGGYERVETVRALSDVIDVWLTDAKYADATLARDLSHAQDYPSHAFAALEAMMGQVRERGGRKLGADGRMERGVIVRHLVMPGHADDSCAVLDRVWDICGNDADLSVMNQYTPNAAMRERHDRLSGPVTQQEYELVLDHADELGFEHMWWQEGGTVDESFVPSFDRTGVDGPELA